MSQTLKVIESTEAGSWTLEIVRDEVKGKIRGYIVTAYDERCAITLHAVSVKRAGSASVATAVALRYMRDAKDGIDRFGILPAYRPRTRKFYN